MSNRGKTDTFRFSGTAYPIEYLLVPVIGVVVLVYGILGGLRAAYFTDLIQGMCIVLLSVILIPYGLNALVEKFGDPSTQGMADGFRIMHEQLPPAQFDVIGSTSSSEFPLHRILAVVLINLVGIVVQPHFIATGGGSAKTETNARVGLVVGNFLKRFCTVGWALTALIALALYADNPDLIADPGKTWGVASRELLGPGLTGLMLACLLAALMSSVDVYMIIGSGLAVRNVYAAYVDPNASEKVYVMIARCTGVIVVGGAVILSLLVMDVFELLKRTWVLPILFAAPFWVGMYWRRATTVAAWLTVIFSASMFFLIPLFAPVVMPELRKDARFLDTTNIIETTLNRAAAPADVARRRALIDTWEEQKAKIDQSEDAAQRAEKLGALGARPKLLSVGVDFQTVTRSGGEAIFWLAGVKPVDEAGEVLNEIKPQPVGEPEDIGNKTTQVVFRYPEGTRLQGAGDFQLNFILYKWINVDLSTWTIAGLDTLNLGPKIVTPFLVMILISWITPRNSKQALDRYFAKMKTPVIPDPEQDHQALEAAYANPEQFEERKMFPGSNLEFSKPTSADITGFIVCLIICFGIIGLAVWVASIGG